MLVSKSLSPGKTCSAMFAIIWAFYNELRMVDLQTFLEASLIFTFELLQLIYKLLSRLLQGSQHFKSALDSAAALLRFILLPF